MAEQQVLNGGTGFTTPSAGVGAVIFKTPSDTPFDVEKNVLADTDDYMKQKQQEQSNAAANTAKLLAGMRFDFKGAQPQHIPYLADQSQKVYETGAKIMQAFQGDLSSPQAQALWRTNVEVPAMHVRADTAMSTGLGAILKDAGDTQNRNPDKFDQVYGNGKIAEIRSMDLPKLRGMAENGQLDLDHILKAKEPDFETLVGKYIKSANPQPQKTESEELGKYGDKNAYYKHITTENITTPQIEAFANNYHTMPAINKAVQNEWSTLKTESPGVVESLMQKYLNPKDGSTPMAPAQAENLAQQEWVKGRLLNEHYNKSDQWIFSHYNEASKLDVAKVKAGLADEKGALYGPTLLYANIMNHVPGQEIGLIGKSLGTYKQLQPKPDKNGNPVYVDIKNAVENVEYLTDGETAVSTTETKDPYSQAGVNPNKKDPQTGLPTPYVGVDHKYIYKKNEARKLMGLVEGRNPNGIDLNAMDKAARNLGTIDANGDIIPDAYISKYSDKFGGSKPSVATPVKQQQKTTTPTSSTVYKVNGINFTEDKVSKAARASGMTIDEYLKAVNK